MDGWMDGYNIYYTLLCSYNTSCIHPAWWGNLIIANKYVDVDDAEHNSVNSLTEHLVEFIILHVLQSLPSVRRTCRTHNPDDEEASNLMIQDKRQKQDASSLEEELHYRLLVSNRREGEKEENVFIQHLFKINPYKNEERG